MKPVDRAEVLAAYRDVAKSTSGQIVFADLAARFGYERGRMFDPNPLILARNTGQLEVLLYIRNVLAGDQVDQTQGEIDGPVS